MKKFPKKVLTQLFIVLLTFGVMGISEVFAESLAPPAGVGRDSLQLLWVTTKDENTHTGFMQRYERKAPGQKWVPVGEPIAIVTGRNGLALAKKEGDQRSPIGVFKIGPAFGYSASPDIKLHLPYMMLSENTFCVDDQSSRFYNKIIDTSKIAQHDWNSGEQMRENPHYLMGAVIQYNSKPIKPGAGSCIFLHIWENPQTATSGCIATDKENLETVLKWLNPKKNPAIGIHTEQLSPT